MIVREQPSPRAQLVHADGTRVYFCAVADLLTYLQAPSPHGAAEAIFVEANDAGAEDPVAHDTARRPWIPAADARFVAGIQRPRVMGEPSAWARACSDERRPTTNEPCVSAEDRCEG